MKAGQRDHEDYFDAVSTMTSKTKQPFPSQYARRWGWKTGQNPFSVLGGGQVLLEKQY